jgi:hypothetical protein
MAESTAKPTAESTAESETTKTQSRMKEAARLADSSE